MSPLPKGTAIVASWLCAKLRPTDRTHQHHQTDEPAMRSTFVMQPASYQNIRKCVCDFSHFRRFCLFFLKKKITEPKQMISAQLAQLGHLSRVKVNLTAEKKRHQLLNAMWAQGVFLSNRNILINLNSCSYLTVTFDGLNTYVI